MDDLLKLYDVMKQKISPQNDGWLCMIIDSIIIGTV